MCLSPITRKTNRKDYRPGVDALYMTVPCGHCVECQQRKIDDYTVRLYYEWQRAKGHNGQMFFITFTYAEDQIPYLDTSSSLLAKELLLPQVDKIRVFDKRQLILSIKKLRQMLKRYYDIDNIKYFVATEYGDEYGRPHYHLLVSIYEHFEANEFRSLCELAWSKQISKEDTPEWFVSLAERYFDSHNRQYFCPSGKDELGYYCAYKDSKGRINFHRKFGYCSYSVDFPPMVTDTKSLAYVAAYTTGDPNFFKHEELKLYYDKVYRANLNDYISDPTKEQLAEFESWKSIIPFTLTSNNLGVDLLYELEDGICDPQSYQEYLNKLAQDQKCLSIGTHFYKIPRYIIQRLFYTSTPRYDYEYMDYDGRIIDITKSSKRLVNAIGVEALTLRYDYRFAHDQALFVKWLDIDHLRSLCRLLDTTNADPETGKLSDHDFCADLINQFSFLKKPDIELLTCYNLTFRNVATTGFYQDLPHLSKKDLLNLARDLKRYEVYSYNDIIRNDERVDMPVSFFVDRFNSLPQFQDFDAILAIYYKIRKFITSQRFNKNPEIRSKVKEYLLSRMYN